MTSSRDLTKAEHTILEMLATIEDYFDRRKLTVLLEMTPEQLKFFRDANLEAIKYTKDDKANKFNVLISTKTYWGYIEYCLARYKMKVLEDGSIETFDKMIVSPRDYLKVKP